MTRSSLFAAAFVMLVWSASGCSSSDAASAGASATPPPSSVALGTTAMRDEGEGDEVVTLGECPPAVRETIVARAGDGVIREIERTTDHGEVLYEVDVATAGGIVEFDVAEDGAFRGYEGGDDDADDEEGGDDRGDSNGDDD